MMKHTTPSESHGRNNCVDCTAKPNPTRGRFNLITSGTGESDLRFILFNHDGQLIKSHAIESAVTKMSIADCKNGTYFLKVMSGENRCKLIRIVKV